MKTNIAIESPIPGKLYYAYHFDSTRNCIELDVPISIFSSLGDFGGIWSCTITPLTKNCPIMYISSKDYNTPYYCGLGHFILQDNIFGYLTGRVVFSKANP